MPWAPTKIELVLKPLKTSMSTCRVRTNDGDAYLKPFGGGDDHPHLLACELVGTCLADWIGLPTPEYVIFQLDGTIDIPVKDEGTVDRGWSFLSREIAGEQWSGDAADIDDVVNREDITKLVVFDTWTMNCDRYCRLPGEEDVRRNLGNVFIARDEARGKRRLIAMDHSHCFTCGNTLCQRLARIDSVKSTVLFGLFPEFTSLIDFAAAEETAARLRRFDRSIIEHAVAKIPRSWAVDQAARSGMCEFATGRAQFLSDKIVAMLRDACRPDGMMF